MLLALLSLFIIFGIIIKRPSFEFGNRYSLSPSLTSLYQSDTVRSGLVGI